MTEPDPNDSPLIRARQWAESDPKRAIRRHNACMTPLDVTRPAQEAFARRQEILIADPMWPLGHWYTDEDFYRAYNTALALLAELTELRGRMSRLEK